MRTGRRSAWGAGITAALLLGGCAHHERRIVRLEPGKGIDLVRFDMHHESLIIELQEGQVIPLDVTVEGDYVTSPPGASVPLTVQRHCFVRVDDRGLRLSPDGQSFDEKPRAPGQFQFGLGATPEGTRATLRLATPVR